MIKVKNKLFPVPDQKLVYIGNGGQGDFSTFTKNLNMQRFHSFCSFALFSYLLLCVACQNTSEPNYYTLPTYNDDNSVNVVIEIPAGTNHKIEYDPQTNVFGNDIENGRDRIINFLPYPGNYGFIPSTLMDARRGGDGDALDVLVLGESLPTKSQIATIPVGVLLLKDNGELDSKIIAMPRDSMYRTMNINNYQDFMIQYDNARRMVEQWFLSYKGPGEMEFIGWKDDRYAREEIEKWAK